MSTHPKDLNYHVTRIFRYLITPDPAGSDPSNNYINAVFGDSFLTRRDIIITQMPLPHTVGDFWRLIHDYNVSVVVMLNDKTENDDSTHQYWPEEGKFFFNFNITGTFGGRIKLACTPGSTRLVPFITLIFRIENIRCIHGGVSFKR